MRQVIATVISNEQLWGEHWVLGHLKFLGAWLIWLKCPEVASEAKPGQFVMVNCGKECLLRRPFSIHQVNEDGIALFYAVLADGKGTRWLSQRQAGDSLDLLGPLGNGYEIHPETRHLLLLAGGIGIAPLHFLADEAIKRGLSVTLLYGTADNKRLSIPSHIKLVSATEDGTVGHKGMITDLLPDYVNRADQVFACGPVSMYKTMSALSEQLPKLKSAQVSLEVRMGCGLGVCYGCTIKTKNGLRQVCKNGPVFNLNDILWEELRG